MRTNAHNIAHHHDKFRVYTKIGGLRTMLILLTDPTTTLPTVVMYHEHTDDMYTLQSVKLRDWPAGVCVFDGTLSKDENETWTYYIFNTLMYSDVDVHTKRHCMRLACAFCFTTVCAISGNMTAVLQPFYAVNKLTMALEVPHHVEGVVFVRDDENNTIMYKWNFREKVRGVLQRKGECLYSAEGLQIQIQDRSTTPTSDHLVECTYSTDSNRWNVVRRCIDRRKAHEKHELSRIATVSNTHMTIDELISVVVE